MSLIRAFAAVALAVATTGSAAASPASEALRARAFNAAYNLDHDDAAALFHEAIAADPDDPGAYRGLATITWLHLIFDRGAFTVDHYLGGISRARVDLKKPPPEVAAAFHDSINRAIALSEPRVLSNPRDAVARYDVGAAFGLLASYTAAVDGQVISAFKSARRAYDEHEKVLQLDPQQKSAALIVGTYRYVVSTLSMPTRWMAYLAGFGGGKERGVQLIEEAARSAGDTQTEADFALIILYNREGRYPEAVKVIEQLQRRYPRNRLLWLEAGSSALRGQRAGEAERWLTEGMALLEGDRRPRMFGEQSLWLYKRGASRVALRKTDAARADLDRALEGDVQSWVRARTHVELGKLADLAGDRARARNEYARALQIFPTSNDPVGEREARALRDTPYK